MINLVCPGEMNSPYSSHQPCHFKGLIEGLNDVRPVIVEIIGRLPYCHLVVVIMTATKIDYDNRQFPGINSLLKYGIAYRGVTCRMAWRSVGFYCTHRL